MIKKTTPLGIIYYEHSYIKGAPLLIYLGGSKEVAEKSIFVSSFIPKYKDKFTIITVSTLPGASGWEYPWGGEWSGVTVVKELKSLYETDSRTFLTGWSAGADYDIAYKAGVTAFAPCAGSGGYQNSIAFGKTGVPVWHFHGTSDTSSPNDFRSGYKTAVEWFQGIGRGNLKFTSINDGGHSSAPSKAYNPETGLGDWFLEQGVPAAPKVVLVGDIQIVAGWAIATGSDNKIYSWQVIKS